MKKNVQVLKFKNDNNLEDSFIVLKDSFNVPKGYQTLIFKERTGGHISW